MTRKYRQPTNEEQKLVHIAIQVAQIAAVNMRNKKPDEIAEWVCDQLNECGFIGRPVGSEWHALTRVLIDEPAPHKTLWGEEFPT